MCWKYSIPAEMVASVGTSSNRCVSPASRVGGAVWEGLCVLCAAFKYLRGFDYGTFL